MSQTSSEDMIDIQIEESLVRETLMSIDSSNMREDIITLIGFFLILVLTILTGIFGPPASISQRSLKYFNNKTIKEQFSYVASPLSPFNRYIDFGFEMLVKPAMMTRQLPLSFSTEITSKKNFAKRHIQTKPHKDFKLLVSRGKNTTKRFTAFTDRIINYDSIEFNIKINKTRKGFPFPGIVITTTIGVHDHTIFQIYFRLIFSVFSIIFMITLLVRLKPVQIRYWHLEQKLTVPLLALAFLYNNPFYIIQAYRPSKIWIFYNTIISGLFTSYFKFFVLVLFDSLRYKNRKTDNCFFAPKIALMLLLFFFSSSHGVTDDVLAFKGSPQYGNFFEKLFRICENILSLTYFIWAGITIGYSAYEVDITERYKFNMYLASGGTSLFLLCLVRMLIIGSRHFKFSSIHFVMTYAVENVFVLLMAYFHWPYEVLQDQNYEDGVHANGVLSMGEFFVNVDSDV